MEKKFIYNNIVVLKTDSDETPKCKLCGGDLEYKPQNKNTFILTNCSNQNCACFNTKSVNIKRLSFVGEEYAQKLQADKRKKNPLCVEYWMNKGYSEEESKEKIVQRQKYSTKFVKKRGVCDKKTMANKIGEENIELFFRKKSRYCIEYWTSRGYSEEDGKKKISELQSKYSKIANGDIEKVKQRSWRCPEYWVRVSGCTIEEARDIISEKQVFFSKEKCIEKYGEKEGLKRWEERQEKWQNTLHNSEKLHVGFSKISQDLFDKILSFYKEEEKDYVFYGSKNHEYCLREGNINYIYDFTDLNKRKIIEFQGDIYHANPLIFEETDNPNPFKKDKTSKDLWEFDEKKKKVAIDNGFSYLAIWESDYRNNEENVIREVLKFLNIC